MTNRPELLRLLMSRRFADWYGDYGRFDCWMRGETYPKTGLIPTEEEVINDLLDFLPPDIITKEIAAPQLAEVSRIQNRWNKDHFGLDPDSEVALAVSFLLGMLRMR